MAMKYLGNQTVILKTPAREQTTVALCMSENPVVLSRDVVVKEALSVIAQTSTECIVVLDGTKPCGIFTTYDVLTRITLDGKNPSEMKLQDVMTTPVEVASISDDPEYVYERMLERKYTQMPVVHGGQLVGMISMRDIIRYEQFGWQSDLKNPIDLDDNELESMKELSIDTIKKLVAEVRRFRNQALIDELTGLFNSRYMKLRLDAEFERAERHQNPLSVIFIDIDNFKQINDKYEHEAGDEVLKIVGTILGASNDVAYISSSFRGCDLVARYGGEEFVVILPDTDVKGAYIAAERYRIAVESFSFYSERLPQPLSITCSLGVASYPEHSLKKETLLRRSDKAMYVAKRNGKNRTVVYGDAVYEEELAK